VVPEGPKQGVPMNAAYFRQLADYNAWANGRIYAASAELSDEERKAKRPSFFGSIHATFNHLLVADRVWLARIAGGESGITRLDQELYADFAELRAARMSEDERITAVVASYKDDDLSETLRYRNMAGEEQATQMAFVLGHLFNHQTHHRGQVHGMLSGTDVAPPSLDLIYLVRNGSAVRR
jgi:uncharacterized damage-inducible protein DinB